MSNSTNQCAMTGSSLHLSPANARLNISRPDSAGTTASKSTTASEETKRIRKNAQNILEKEALPSLYDGPGFEERFTRRRRETDDTLVGPVIDNNVKGFGESGRTGNDKDSVWRESNDDRQSPVHWTKVKKGKNISIIFLICIVSPWASSVIAPALPDMTIALKQHDDYLSAFVVSAYVLGYAIGSLLIGPLSEIYGRVPLYHICNLVFVLFTCLCAIGKSLGFVTAMRFLAGCGGASAFTLAPASIADMISKEGRGTFMALIGIGYNLGPAFAPLAGYHINKLKNWNWIFWITATMGAFCTLAAFLTLDETYEPVLLRRKTNQLHKEKHNDTLHPGLDSGLTPRQTLFQAMIRPLKMLFCLPDILLVSFLTAVGYGYLYILYTILPTTFLTRYDYWRTHDIGFVYMGLATGNILGMVLGGLAMNKLVAIRAKYEDTRVELRLIPMIFFWPLTGMGLLIFGWTAHFQKHWVWPLVGSGVFAVGSMSAILFCTAYVVDTYERYAASATAATLVARSILGGVIPVFTNKLYARFSFGFANSILGATALALCPIPFLFYRFGEKLRAKFPFAG